MLQRYDLADVKITILTAAMVSGINVEEEMIKFFDDWLKDYPYRNAVKDRKLAYHSKVPVRLYRLYLDSVEVVKGVRQKINHERMLTQSETDWVWYKEEVNKVRHHIERGITILPNGAVFVFMPLEYMALAARLLSFRYDKFILFHQDGQASYYFNPGYDDRYIESQDMRIYISRLLIDKLLT